MDITPHFPPKQYMYTNMYVKICATESVLRNQPLMLKMAQIVKHYLLLG